MICLMRLLDQQANQIAGALRRRCQFRPALRDGPRRESAVAQLFSSGSMTLL